MHHRIVRKGLVVGIVGILVLMAVAPSAPANKSLDRTHLLQILKGYIFLNDQEIKNIVRSILIEIIKTNDATYSEIYSIINSSGLQFETLYLFASVETSERTDGLCQCEPGYLRAEYGKNGYNSRGSYVYYRRADLALYDWHLRINGIKVSEKDGYFLGYMGHIETSEEHHIPGIYYSFIVDGTALMVFHGVN